MRTNPSGFVLPLVLVFLILYAGLLLRAHQTVSTELLLNRYLEDEIEALIAAESALSTGLRYLKSEDYSETAFDENRSDGLFIARDEISSAQINWSTEMHRLKTYAGVKSLPQAPAYSIQQLAKADTLSVSSRGNQIHWFRLISRGVASSNRQVVILEMLVRLSYADDLAYINKQKTLFACCWRQITL